MQYYTRHVPVTVIQWLGHNTEQVIDFVGDQSPRSLSVATGGELIWDDGVRLNAVSVNEYFVKYPSGCVLLHSEISFAAQIELLP